MANRSESRVNVLVTGVGGGGLGHEIVKALNMTGRYRLIGVDMAESAYGLFEVDEAYTIPSAQDERYVETLLDICKTRNAKALVLGSEPELKVISMNRHLFEEIGVTPLINSPEIIDLCMDKWATMKSLKEHGFSVPQSFVVMREEEIPTDFPLPALIKPSIGGGGSNNTFVVQDNEELSFACRFIIRQGGEALVQQYIGTPYEEYTVGVLSSFDGELIGSIALRRGILSSLSNRVKIANRTGREELSPTLAISSGVSQGEIGEFPEVRKVCEDIAAALDSKGPLNIQLRVFEGHVFPFEINPRLSGTSYMRALVGFNEPDMLIRRHVLGERISAPDQIKFGRIVRGLNERFVEDGSRVGAWGG